MKYIGAFGAGTGSLLLIIGLITAIDYKFNEIEQFIAGFVVGGVPALCVIYTLRNWDNWS